MPMPYTDRFSRQAAEYRRFRPTYPTALFAHLAALASRRRAWDASTGNGQAAVALGAYFGEVVATDASPRQLAHAQPHPRVRYAASLSETSPLPSASVDLVTVAQAAHWLDCDTFYAEVRRVAVPGGVVALWGYGLPTVSRPVDRLLETLYHETVGPYWAPERRYVETGYATLPFPFAPLPVPRLSLAARWDSAAYLGYVGTWSAVARYRRERGEDPMEAFAQRVEAAWGAGARQVAWPLFARLGRVGTG